MTRTIRIDFPDQEGWAEVCDVTDWTQRRYDAWRKLARSVAVNAEDPTATAEAEQWVRDVVASWHLVDPDSGTVLNDPKTDDLAGLKVSTTRAILTKAVELASGAVTFRSS